MVEDQVSPRAYPGQGGLQHAGSARSEPGSDMPMQKAGSAWVSWLQRVGSEGPGSAGSSQNKGDCCYIGGFMMLFTAPN